LPEKISWMSERRKVSELIPASYNPRKISDKQSDALNKSLERFDLADPIIINTAVAIQRWVDATGGTPEKIE